MIIVLFITVDGNPMISPTKDKENTNHNVPPHDRDRKQMIVPMDMELWQVCKLKLDSIRPVVK